MERTETVRIEDLGQGVKYAIVRKVELFVQDLPESIIGN